MSTVTRARTVRRALALYYAYGYRRIWKALRRAGNRLPELLGS